ncbi:MAG: RDD family protein [Chloroflexi bacterium]|nr:RDD family protein [Chloroflexota bacterium]
MRDFNRRELVAATEDDVLIMVADIRSTLIAGFVGGIGIISAFIGLAVVLASLWELLRPFYFGILIAAVGLVIFIAFLGITGYFIPELLSARVVGIFIAVMLVLAFAVASLTADTTGASVLTNAGGLLLSMALGIPVLIGRLWVVVIAGGVLGTVVAAVQRDALQHEKRMRLYFTSIFTLDVEPHTFLAIMGGNVLAISAITAAFSPPLIAGLSASVVLTPVWVQAGFLFQTYWRPLMIRVLDRRVGQQVWFRRNIGLMELLQGEDSDLTGATFMSAGVDSERMVARVKGYFRHPDQMRRVQESAMRIRGLTAVEVEDLAVTEAEEDLVLEDMEAGGLRCPRCRTPVYDGRLFCTECKTFVQNEDLGHRAHFFPRFLAASLDFAVPVGLILLFGLTGFNPADGYNFLTIFWQYLFMPIVYGIFFVSFLVRGTTPGKSLFGLEVVQLTQHRYPGFKTMLRREVVGKFVSLLPLTWGFLSAFWDKNGQTWHDKMVGTVVVRDPDVW